MGIAEDELRRLRSGPGPEDDRARPFLVRVRFTAADPARVVAGARAVLRSVVGRTDDWPAAEQWPQLLPAWFVRRCAPEPVEPEPGAPPFDAEEWLRQWRAMTPEQRAAADREPWTLSDWLHCFDPTEDGGGGDRGWWWWHAGTDGPGTGRVQVETTGWPFGSGSLRWLIEAAAERT
ncbi:hypothetical protein ACFQ1I_06245 [Kitasatospora arboriphila]